MCAGRAHAPVGALCLIERPHLPVGPPVSGGYLCGLERDVLSFWYWSAVWPGAWYKCCARVLLRTESRTAAGPRRD